MNDYHVFSDVHDRVFRDYLNTFLRFVTEFGIL
ncbi:hypothetical protein NIES4071_11440 [Calothrix sp. NIES-4071]|nr:hypothetical protein NIES4071_11440 [Calothrix sp. NIES-4071]BAZ55484.1 hypothetical protein NIES4105_11400 [Calothrix sp. NIES-4105]